MRISAPHGLRPPVVYPLSPSQLRVSWLPPLQPNGKITAYNILLDDIVIYTNMSNAGAYVINNLRPYTVYVIKVCFYDALCLLLYSGRSQWEKIQANLHSSRGITLKRVTNEVVLLRCSVPGQDSSEETSQRWRVIGDNMSDLTGPGSEPLTFRSDSNNVTTTPINRLKNLVERNQGKD